jgi:hypothetical protein
MCTNRLGALDPAIQRRAADILTFERPTSLQRKFILKNALQGTGFHEHDIDALVVSTGATKDRSYGYTFSDLTQRLLPAIVLDAYPNTGIHPKRALEIAKHILPTAPFKDA